jgi:hypothetical protein
MHSRVVLALLWLGIQSTAAQVKLSTEQLSHLPPPATRPVDFTADIKPILEASCVNCHGRGKERGGFKLDTRETFLQPADSGPAVVVGKSDESYLVHLVAGVDPDLIMPEKGRRLTPEQVGLLRAWIDQGLPWDRNVTFAREAHRNLLPRKVEPPDASAEAVQPVDRFVWAYFRERGITPPQPVDDRTFARRAFLDVVGILPDPEELEAFLGDTRPDKRERLVRSLLSDDTRYAQHWLTFWNDRLRNDYRGTGYIDGGREQITQWLYTALKENKPYDAFVRELISPGENGPRGFTRGIVWRGAVNASQTPPVQAAQNISQVFLGVNLKCASCHDSFIDDWQLTDAYGMAAIYAEERLELVRCDKPLGTFATAKFLFPELGTIESDAPKSERVARLAEILVQPRNGRLTRTIVNRLWSRFLGRGLVEPLDVMQNPAWIPDLLDWLAEDFAAHDYNLKRTMELILASRTYQLPSVNVPEEPATDFVFRGPAVRRLSAEQFRDALGQLTGVWHDKPEGGLDSLLFEKGKAEPLPAAAYWIWSDAHGAEGVPPQTVFFRKIVELPEVPAEAIAFVNADNTHRLWVNGREARRRNDIPWDETSILDLRPYLKEGRNVFAIEAANGGDAPNPAGLLFYARLRPAQTTETGSNPDGRLFDFGSDASWQVTTNQFENWQKPEFETVAWSSAQVLGPPGTEPWNIGAPFAATVHGRSIYGSVRASLVASDPLTRALGRPNREQITSARPYTATTIQMLELTNGETLARLLGQGAEHLAASASSGKEVVETIFERALGRPPTAEEAKLSAKLLGAEARKDGVEDLLWAVAMLPEFQLIY